MAVSRWKRHRTSSAGWRDQTQREAWPFQDSDPFGIALDKITERVARNDTRHGNAVGIVVRLAGSVSDHRQEPVRIGTTIAIHIEVPVKGHGIEGGLVRYKYRRARQVTQVRHVLE